MAHKLEIRNGKASMMYFGDEPWHGLGKKLDRPATAAEAISAANMDWEVVKAPLFAVPSADAVVASEHYGVVRKDFVGTKDCAVLGVVGKAYTPLQNRDAFKFFDPIVGNDAAVYHTAGVLEDGKRVWILAKLPGHIRVIGDDIAHKYLLLSNSHDGNSAVQVKFTPVRVVCNNTLTMALQQGRTLRVEHTPNLQRNLRTARENLGIIEAEFGNIEKAFQAMAKVEMNEKRLHHYFDSVFPYPSLQGDKRKTGRVDTQRAWAVHFFEEGMGNKENGVGGTLWAAYNGITEYVDHCMGRQQTPQAHLNRVWFGKGCDIKVRAYRTGVEMARDCSN